MSRERQLISLRRQITELSQKLISPPNTLLPHSSIHTSHATPRIKLGREVSSDINIVNETSFRPHEGTSRYFE